MKTNQVMIRSLDDIQVGQRTSDSFFNATDMLRYFNEKTGGNKRFKDFWENQGTGAFIEALNIEILNGGNSAHSKILETQRGKGGATWMHPYLFVKFCFWLSPQFEVKVIKWVYDNLILSRHMAGDLYKEMCEAIKDTYLQWKGKEADPLIYVKEANYINLLVFGNTQGRQRNEATEFELMMINKLQKLNINLMRSITPITERKAKLKQFSDMLTISK